MALGTSTMIFHTDPGTDIWLEIRFPVNWAGPQMIRISSPSDAKPRV